MDDLIIPLIDFKEGIQKSSRTLKVASTYYELEKMSNTKKTSKLFIIKEGFIIKEQLRHWMKK